MTGSSITAVAILIGYMFDRPFSYRLSKQMIDDKGRRWRMRGSGLEGSAGSRIHPVRPPPLLAAQPQAAVPSQVTLAPSLAAFAPSSFARRPSSFLKSGKSAPVQEPPPANRSSAPAYAHPKSAKPWAPRAKDGKEATEPESSRGRPRFLLSSSSPLVDHGKHGPMPRKRLDHVRDPLHKENCPVDGYFVPCMHTLAPAHAHIVPLCRHASQGLVCYLLCRLLYSVQPLTGVGEGAFCAEAPYHSRAPAASRSNWWTLFCSRLSRFCALSLC